jgi:hypothetical protein
MFVVKSNLIFSQNSVPFRTSELANSRRTEFRKEHFFLRNNKNCFESVPRNFFVIEFDGNPTPIAIK